MNNLSSRLNDLSILPHHKDMRPKRDSLTDLKTAFNCPAKWQHMSGDERVRHCTKCSQKVYNISAMTRDEAVKLIEESGGKACVRFYQKADGTILTRPCRGVQRATYGWKLAGFSALALVGFPIFAPVYAGEMALSPQAEFRIQLRQVQRYNQQLAETKDKDEREVIFEMRKEATERLKEVYAQLTPEDIEEFGPLTVD